MHLSKFFYTHTLLDTTSDVPCPDFLFYARGIIPTHASPSLELHVQVGTGCSWESGLSGKPPLSAMHLMDVILRPSVYTHSFTVWETQALLSSPRKRRPLPQPLQELQRHFGASNFPFSWVFLNSSKTSLNRSSLQLQAATQQLPAFQSNPAVFVPFNHSLLQFLPMLFNYCWTYRLGPPADTTPPGKLKSRLLSLLGRQTHEVRISTYYWAFSVNCSWGIKFRLVNLGTGETSISLMIFRSA